MNPKNLTQEEILKRIELLAYRKRIRERFRELLTKTERKRPKRRADTRKIIREARGLLEVLFWIIIILSIVVPGAYDAWIK